MNPGFPGSSKRKARPVAKKSTAKKTGSRFKDVRFDNVHQVGGIRTGTLDTAGPGGPSVRCAFFNTGANLRFTVALDRGGDIIDASYQQHGLAYLSPQGLLPPSHAYNFDADWLYGWPGGLLTSCGPIAIGWPKTTPEMGQRVGLHGHYSNVVTRIESLVNPDPARGQMEMSLTLVGRDARVFGPVIEVRRTISCTLGEPQVRISDTVTNLGNTVMPHGWLYHINFGYPLVDEGTRLVYKGEAVPWDFTENPPARDEAWLNKIKTVSAPLTSHKGMGEHGAIVDLPADRDGFCNTGLFNPRLNLGVMMTYPKAQFPRMANWQHLGPNGSYVTGLEPFNGSLLGLEKDKHPAAKQTLKPGEAKQYDLAFTILDGEAEFKQLTRHDGKVTLSR
jgi:hypothetical protein